jgi:hypothetical protein
VNYATPVEAITGHTIASINEVLDRYTKLTADRTGAALERRLAHENGSVRQLFERPTGNNELRTKR